MSRGHPRSALGQPLRRFSVLCDAAFGAALARHGFLPVSQPTSSSPHLGERLYQVGDRYVRITGTTHPLDLDPGCGIALGQGSSSWPESDWNSIALWQLAGNDAAEGARPDNARFALLDVANLPRLLRRMCRAMERDAADFLTGDLRRFRKARAASAASRQPYRIVEKGPGGGLVAREDAQSAALRARFARLRGK